MNKFEETMRGADMEMFNKDNVIELFEKLWYKYYLEDRDTKFESNELMNLWFLFKMTRLIELSESNDLKAKRKMTTELNLNASRYVNPNFRIKEVANA